MLRRFLFQVIAVCCAISVHAQVYNFRNFSFDQGLPESSISTVYEDTRGNLWIGTLGGGLLQYDGVSFRSYLQEDGLVNNFVHAIYEDNTGKLWIGTEDGICTYDGTRFSSFGALTKQTINAILQDASRQFWFATGSNGLYKYDGTVLRQITTKNGLTSNNVHCLYQDKKGTLWIGTAKGVVNTKGQRFNFYTKADGLSGDNVYGITEDHVGNYWLATDGGVSQFNGTDFVNYSVKNGLRSNNVHAVAHDNKGNLWVGTSGGISKYNGKSFEYYDPNTGQGVNIITCIYKDTAGNLWFGSAERGLSKLDSERFVHYPENDQMGKRVYAIIQAINGNMICGTSLGGTTVFDGRQYTLLDGIEGFTSSIVQTFYYAPDSTLWVGTQDEGAYKFSKSRFQRYTVEEGLVSNNITGFATDARGNMWLATGDSGVSVLQSNARDSVHVLKNYTTANGLASNAVSAIAYDRAGTIWIGTEDHGVSRITVPPDSTQHPVIIHLTTKEGLSSNAIHTIILDSLGRVYIGTSKGISIYDGKRFVNISKADGLGSNTIYALTLDRNQDLWAGTERGVDRISFDRDFTSRTVRHFGNDEGFKGGEVYRNSSCTDREGNIWFGTVNGLVKYNPKEEVAADLTPKIHLTGIKLFFDKIEDTKYADSVSAWYSIPTELTLPYHQNNLTFSFVGIHHRNPQAVRYKWILEGFGNDWSPAIAEREATFSNLPPGNYTFKVMACNEYNTWNETPASFSFRIEAPFWERWWVRAAGFVFIVLFIWMIFYFRLKRIQAKNRVIQEKLEMEKSILELEQEAARLQMNPHFIFNSLNSIQGFISINDPVQAKKYLAKFARLMRLILENAREEFIPLQNEINILDNYLELEKLSTNHKFDFTITTDESIDPENIEIPPMMIQPFVENAIVHGIKKKEGRGIITVHFKTAGALILCEITDNGIGRKKSGLLNGQTRSNHKSTGISVTTRRLEQYGQHLKVNAGVEIIDLEEDGNPTGTRVIISSPFEGS
jgi:ligand-binding sensor domain-containing protein